MPVDEDGDGIVSDTGDERMPLFVQAVGDNGVEGYARIDDLEGTTPSSPEEALEQNQQIASVPIYAEDLTTVIDTLTESDGEPIEEANDAG